MPPRNALRPSPPPPPPRCAAVVVAAGSSSRMGGKLRKPYLELRGRPLLAWTLERLGRTPGLVQLVVVTRPEDRRRAMCAALLARLRSTVALDFAAGGARRQDSVYNGLRATAEDAELVLIHDAARPFPPLQALGTALGLAARAGAAILAVRARDTLKRQDPETHPEVVRETVPRAGLWLAQTPQVFRRALLLELFARLRREAPEAEVTDDAAVCERFGQAVALVESSVLNLKITRPEDLCVAEAYLRAGLVRS